MKCIFELLANAEATADFDTYSAIGYLISDLKISVLHGTNSPTQPTPNLDQNEIIRNSWCSMGRRLRNRRHYHHQARHPVWRRLRWMTIWNIFTTKYDEQGIVRRAAFYAVPREVITVDVRDNTQPIDNVTFR